MLYLKILGAVLVIAASFGIGMSIGALQNNQAKDLKELLLFAGIIKGNLTYNASEITEIIEQGARKTKGAVSVWLEAVSDGLSSEKRRSFENIWSDSIEILKEESYLSKEQIGQVSELGKWLCYMDADAQVKNIMLWERSITDEYEEQKRLARQINRVAGSLGLLGGILLVILIF